MIETKEQYFKLNQNSNSLNKDRIVKHFLSYYQGVMIEHEDRDMREESQQVKEFSYVISYLTDLDTLIKRVEFLENEGLIDKQSTLVEECISGSRCEGYDYDTDEEEKQYYSKKQKLRNNS